MSANSTLSNEIAEELRSDILRGHFREAERLPSERDLSSRFSASRGAVREALSQLQQLGLIDVQLGGARVQALKDARIAVLGPLLSLEDLPDPGLIEQFLQTFGALAVLTAEEAVSRADQGQLNRLQEVVVLLDTLADDHVAQQEQWREFCQSLTEIADNLVVQLIGNDLRAQFIDQVMKLGIQPNLRKGVMGQILSGLKQGLNKRDREKVGSAVKLYFDELLLSMRRAMAERVPEYQQPRYQQSRYKQPEYQQSGYHQPEHQQRAG